MLGHHLRRAVAGAEVAGVPSTWNPLDKHAEISLFNDDKTAVSIAGLVWKSVRGTVSKNAGLFYWETNIDTAVLNACVCGLGNAAANLASFCGSDPNGWGLLLGGSGSADKFHSGNGTGLSVAAFAASNVRLRHFWDANNGDLWWAIENVPVQGDPATLTGPSYSGVVGDLFPMTGISYTGIPHQMSIITDDANFKYTPPANFTDRFLE